MGSVVVVNGWYRTGSTLCFYTVQRILAAKGVPFLVAGQDYKDADQMIANYLESDSDEWLVLKSHNWMPSDRSEGRVITIYTKRHPADIMRSAIAYRRRQAAADGVPYDEAVIFGQLLSGLQWLLLFYRYVLPHLPMNVIDYETYYSQPKALIEHLGQLLGFSLTADQIDAIALEVDVQRVKEWTDNLDGPMDQQSHFRKHAVSESLGEPDGSLEGLPEVMRILIERAYP